MELTEVPLEAVLVCLVLVTLLTVLAYLAHSGLFTTVTVSTLEPATGAITVAYKTRLGHYKDAGELFTESYCLLPDREQLGIYYDDPEGVPWAECRCAVGPVLAQSGEKPVKEEMDKMMEAGFRILHLPKPEYVVTASFPFTTTCSIFLGVWRVYPRLRDYIAARRLCAYPALELYSDSAITYMMPLSRQDEFFVPEFQEDEVSIATTDMGEETERRVVVEEEEGREGSISSSDGEEEGEEAEQEEEEKEEKEREDLSSKETTVLREQSTGLVSAHSRD